MTPTEAMEKRFQHMLTRPMMHVSTLGELEAAALAVIECWELTHRVPPAISVREAFHEARHARGLTNAGSLADWAGRNCHSTSGGSSFTGRYLPAMQGTPQTDALVAALHEVFNRVKKSLPPLVQLAMASE